MIFNCRIYRNYQYFPLKEIYKKFQKKNLLFFYKKVLTKPTFNAIIKTQRTKEMLTMKNYITKEQLEQMREDLAKSQGLECGNDVRCYHCKKWGYNRGKVMDSMGQSKCYGDTTIGKTASYQWCKHFDYVGSGK